MTHPVSGSQVNPGSPMYAATVPSRLRSHGRNLLNGQMFMIGSSMASLPRAYTALMPTVWPKRSYGVLDDGAPSAAHFLRTPTHPADPCSRAVILASAASRSFCSASPPASTLSVTLSEFPTDRNTFRSRDAGTCELYGGNHSR